MYKKVEVEYLGQKKTVPKSKCCQRLFAMFLFVVVIFSLIISILYCLDRFGKIKIGTIKKEDNKANPSISNKALDQIEVVQGQTISNLQNVISSVSNQLSQTSTFMNTEFTRITDLLFTQGEILDVSIPVNGIGVSYINGFPQISNYEDIGGDISFFNLSSSSFFFDGQPVTSWCDVFNPGVCFNRSSALASTYNKQNNTIRISNVGSMNLFGIDPTSISESVTLCVSFYFESLGGFSRVIGLGGSILSANWGMCGDGTDLKTCTFTSSNTQALGPIGINQQQIACALFDFQYSTLSDSFGTQTISTVVSNVNTSYVVGYAGTASFPLPIVSIGGFASPSGAIHFNKIFIARRRLTWFEQAAIVNKMSTDYNGQLAYTDSVNRFRNFSIAAVLFSDRLGFSWQIQGIISSSTVLISSYLQVNCNIREFQIFNSSYWYNITSTNQFNITLPFPCTSLNTVLINQLNSTLYYGFLSGSIASFSTFQTYNSSLQNYNQNNNFNGIWTRQPLIGQVYRSYANSVTAFSQFNGNIYLFGLTQSTSLNTVDFYTLGQSINNVNTMTLAGTFNTTLGFQCQNSLVISDVSFKIDHFDILFLCNTQGAINSITTLKYFFNTGQQFICPIIIEAPIITLNMARWLNDSMLLIGTVNDVTLLSPSF